MDIYNSQPSHGGMFMRSHPPSGLKHMNPVVFLHTDHHSGEYWDTKPDGDPGWVSVFNNEGFMVYAPDLPFCGKSKGFGSAMVALGLPAMRFTPQFAEAMLTAPERINHFHWMGVEHHTQWPGTGLRGDPCFEAYFRKTEVKMLGDQERQTRAQHSLVDFLNTLEHPAILVGHGSGANLAYLAADRAPERVAAIVALEPIGPPFANALRNSSRSDGTKLEYTSEYVSIPTNQPGVRCRPYGVSDIPLQFDPPPLPPTTMEDILDEGSRYQPIPFVEVFDQKAKQFCYLQDESVHPPRKLTNLQKIPNCIFTAGSSSHSAYDWATVAFLKQAGVPVQHLELAVKNGNGPLFFLEKNSSKLALSLINWLRGNILSRPSLGLLNPPPSTGAAQNSS
ncbi:Alpha/Beta hydrolase protein, partial [Podospora australis]